jgi:hypothetical protein
MHIKRKISEHEKGGLGLAHDGVSFWEGDVSQAVIS